MLEIPELRHGWFKIRKMQNGDRTPDEQMLGLQFALESARGKTVLDLGCAEGMISREFGAVASRVVGIELLEEHLEVARVVCKRLPHVRFIHSELGKWIDEHPEPEKFDVVLALSVAHKLKDPAIVLRFAARSARQMVVFRGPGRDGMLSEGWLMSKFGGGFRCHVETLMAEEGFTEGWTLPSARDEKVTYWHRA